MKTVFITFERDCLSQFPALTWEDKVSKRCYLLISSPKGTENQYLEGEIAEITPNQEVTIYVKNVPKNFKYLGLVGSGFLFFT